MKLQVDQLHITESLTRLGGVETLVRQLLLGNPGSHAVALLDPPETKIAKGVGLRAGKHAGAVQVRRAGHSLFSHARHLVFHNFAGMMMLSGTIPHDRKCLFLHTNSPDIFELLPERLPYLDTILVSGRDLENEVRDRFPGIGLPVTALEYPLDDRYFSSPQRQAGPQIHIGYAGRLEHEQKQVMRLAALCQSLVASKVDFTLEIAGTGSAIEELRRQLPPTCSRFLGALHAGDLATTYQRWDFIICTSDYETGPLVALEAMAAGVIPILPDIPCQATSLIKDLELPVYPVGDMGAAARLIHQLATAPDTPAMRGRLREKVADRRVDRFVHNVNAVLDAAAASPVVALTPAVPMGIAEYLPFALRRGSNAYLR